MSRWCWKTGCLVVVAALAVTFGSTLAQAEDDNLDMVEMLLKQRQPEQALKLFEHLLPSLAEDPDRTCKACGFMEKYARANTLAAGGDGTTASLIQVFVGLADKCLAENGESAEAHRAKAHALGAVTICEIASTRFDGSGNWEACAKLCTKASELSKTRKSQYLADTARYLGDWYPHAAARQAEVREKVLATIKAGLEASPDDADLTAALGAFYVNEAKSAIAAGKKNDAKKAIVAAIDAVKPDGDVPLGRKGNLQAGGYNALLTLAGRNKIKVKGDYIMAEKKSTEWLVSYPRGRGWEFSLSGDTQGVFTLSRETEHGELVVHMRAYSWNINYTTPDGEAGGDNITGLMRQNQQLVMEGFTEVDKHKKKIGGKLNKRIKKTTGYEIRGADEEDNPYYVRCWAFKGDEHQRSYLVQVRITGQGPEEENPEIEAILDSLEEREKK
jgi:hypothetical protein